LAASVIARVEDRTTTAVFRDQPPARDQRRRSVMASPFLVHRMMIGVLTPPPSLSAPPSRSVPGELSTVVSRHELASAVCVVAPCDA
jgi:hypothetical protein